MNIDLDGNFWFNLSYLDSTEKGNIFNGNYVISYNSHVSYVPFMVVQELLIFEEHKSLHT